VVILLLMSSASCSLTLTHPVKGSSVFDSYRPTKNMSASLQKDLKNCRNYAYSLRIKSGMRLARNLDENIKQCLRKKGWSFSI